jgi:hypothetical protein
LLLPVFFLEPLWWKWSGILLWVWFWVSFLREKWLMAEVAIRRQCGMGGHHWHPSIHFSELTCPVSPLWVTLQPSSEVLFHIS